MNTRSTRHLGLVATVTSAVLLAASACGTATPGGSATSLPSGQVASTAHPSTAAATRAVAGSSHASSKAHVTATRHSVNARAASAQGAAALARSRSGLGAAASRTAGFNLYNLSGYTLLFTEVSQFAGAGMEDPPSVGDQIAPGGHQHFELISGWPQTTSTTLGFAVLDLSGRKVGESGMRLDYLPGELFQVSRGITGGPQCTDGYGTITITDPPGTIRTIGADQPQLQRDVLDGVCRNVDKITCTFKTIGKEKHIQGPWHQASDRVLADRKGKLKFSGEDTVGQTDSVGAEVKVGTSLFHIVEVEITASYHHEWSREHKFVQELELDLDPGDIAWLETRSPLIRVTGDFTITTGNTTWLLKGVNFDSPDIDAKGDWHGVARERGGFVKIIPGR